MFVADKDGNMQGDLEQRNGSGSGPVIWSALIWKYENLIWPDSPLGAPPYSSHNYTALFEAWEKHPDCQHDECAAGR